MPSSLPVPAVFDRDRVGEVWRVPYAQLAIEARQWSLQHQIEPAAGDRPRIALLMIDVQNTFCTPEFELFVGGRSGNGAVEDSGRLCEFIYRNLPYLTELIPTLDTHGAMQIFHPIFWVDPQGNHPAPLTNITWEDVQQGRWRPNPKIASRSLENTWFATGLERDHLPSDRPESGDENRNPDSNLDPNNGDQSAFDLPTYALHYTKTLHDLAKYPLTIWPYHSILGGIGHAMVSAVEAACFFHAIARHAPTRFELKGGHPLTENYSILQPEVLDDEQHQAIAQKNTALIDRLLTFDAVLIAGQAKSHCVAWTIADLLAEIQAHRPSFAKQVYILEDCMSPVVVPGVVDFTEMADQTFQGFAKAGLNLVRSTEPIEQWPGFASLLAAQGDRARQ